MWAVHCEWTLWNSSAAAAITQRPCCCTVLKPVSVRKEWNSTELHASEKHFSSQRGDPGPKKKQNYNIDKGKFGMCRCWSLREGASKFGPFFLIKPSHDWINSQVLGYLFSSGTFHLFSFCTCNLEWQKKKKNSTKSFFFSSVSSNNPLHR